MEKKVVLRERDISDNLQSIAEAILQRNPILKDVVLVGIRTGGAFLAARLQDVIKEKTGTVLPMGVLDITLYRDDWTRIGPAPVVGKTELPFSVDDKTVVLVDDVLFTGRTVRAAMDALMDYGRPRRIALAVLVDRGERNRELPIFANYVGAVYESSADTTVNVYLKEEGYYDHVAIEEKGII